MAFNAVFAWFIGKRMNRVNFYRDNPIAAQRSVHEYLFYQLKKTQFYKGIQDLSIQEIECLRDIPLHDYNTLKPFIDRTMSGEEDVLWPGETKWFAQSSGTTANRKKLIPVTFQSLEENHYANGKDLLAQYYANLPNRKLFNAKHLIVGGSGEIRKENNGVFVGDLSAIIIDHLPWWTELRRTPAKEIALQGNWEVKLDKMAKAVVNENVCIIAGMPSWTSLLLRRILEVSSKKTIAEVWPNLELYIHGGMNFGPYRKTFEELIGREVNFIESYNSSEGYFGMQDRLHGTDLLLMTNSEVYFEFIPMVAFNGIYSTETLLLSEVSIDTEYALVISTSAGLWRYIIGDTIKFTQLNPYRFIVTGRTTQFLNAFGEKVLIHHVEKTIEAVNKSLSFRMTDYTIAPYYRENSSVGGHQWLIEFESPPSDIDAFEAAIDYQLKIENADYEAKRYMDLNIGKPIITYLPKGTFHQWLAKHQKLGGQHKIPRLMNDRQFVEQLLTMLS
jgi:hypothetical protein